MTLLDALLLGLIQGLTEFLPVSSSGHLVVSQHLLGVGAEENVVFDVTLHVGSLLAVFAVYAGDLRRVIAGSLRGLGLGLRGRWREGWAIPDARLGAWIVLGTVPAVIAGLWLQDLFASLFASRLTVGVALLVTATVLVLSGYVADPRRRGVTPRTGASMRGWDALGIGIAQAAAITPGISRSGSTIAAALALGLDRELAARFSFLLSIPAILGALVLHLDEALQGGEAALGPLAVGFVTAAVSGYLALRFLIRLVARGRFGVFAWYLYPLGAAVVAWALLSP